jgi:deoxyribonuclease (pyrimidine dimer)
VKSGRAKVVNLPERFTLGAGHVKFFYNKLGYLRGRYADLLKECKRRGFAVTDKTGAFDNLPPGYLGDYATSPEDRAIIVDRIESKGFALRAAT